jgi:tight adherence protein C
VTSVALVLGVAWAVVVLGAAWRWRPPGLAGRRAAVAAPDRRHGADPQAWAPATAIGRRLRSWLHRPPDATTDQVVGRAALATIVAAVLAPPLVPVAVATAWLLPWLARRRAARDAEAAVVAELPEVVDLCSLAIGAGLNVALAVRAVGERAPPVIGRALRDAAARAGLGERLADALDMVCGELGEPVRPLVRALTSSERYGVPLRDALDRLAVEVRLDRRRRAEEAARRVPVKLLFPLVLCVLPAFALLTVVPLLVGAFRSLRL